MSTVGVALLTSKFFSKVEKRKWEGAENRVPDPVLRSGHEGAAGGDL